MKKRLALLLVLAALLVGMVAPSFAAPDPKELVVYFTFHENEAKRLFALFEKQTGVKVKYLALATGQAVARVEAEATAPQADIFLGAGAENHEAMKMKGLLAPYASPSADAISKAFKDRDGYWTGLYLGPEAIIVNKDRFAAEFAPKGIPMPKTWSDLLRPEFKGEIVMPGPALSSTGYTFLASYVQKYGEDAAWAFFKALDKNINHYTKKGLAPAQFVATGEFVIGINFIHDQLLMQKAGFNVDIIVPPDAGWEIGSVSIIKNGPNTANAKKFIDFVLGEQAQQLHTDLTMRIPTRADVELPGGVKPLAELNIFEGFNVIKAASDKAALLDKWAKAIGR
ncbi:MAG: ABC transporter substrate-binding protein [Clostridia bacterium]|nr:ABC transporter substrate-binding protein [Clostridia bacterium]